MMSKSKNANVEAGESGNAEVTGDGAETPELFLTQG